MTVGSRPGADFLTRLADRALEIAPRVEPRLPARFETRLDGAGQLGAGWVDEGEYLSETVGGPAVRGSNSRPAAPAPSSGEVAAAPVARPQPRRTARRAEPEPDLPPTAALQAARSATPLTSVAPAAERPAAATVVRPVVATARPSQVLPPRLEIAPPRARTADAPADHRARPRAPDDPPPPTAATALAAAPLAPVIAAPARREARRPDAAPPEPVINISIGRIDIRAPADPPAPSRPQAQASREPIQSLEAYLKQRTAAER